MDNNSMTPGSGTVPGPIWPASALADASDSTTNWIINRTFMAPGYLDHLI